MSEENTAETTEEPDASTQTDDAKQASQAAEDVQEQGDEEGGDEESTPTDSQPGFSARQLNAARRYGLDADALGDNADGVLTKLADAESDIGKRYSQLGRAARQAPEKAPSAESGAAEEASGPFSPDVFGEDITDANRRFVTVEKLVKELVGFRDDYHEERQADVADTFFTSLPKGLYPQFGEGTIADIGEHSREAGERAELIEEARAQQLGVEAATGRTISFREALQRAVHIVAPDAKVDAEKARLEDASKRQAKRGTARPTPRRGSKKLTGDQQTDAVLKQVTEELGIDMPA